MADPYVTVDEFKSWIPGRLNDTIDDPVINKKLKTASRAIDKYCKTHFWKTAVGTTRLFDACDTRRLRINDAAAVTGIATDRDANGVYETVWTAADFQLLPLNPDAAPETLPFTEILAIGSLTFPVATSVQRIGLVQVTGTWGWSSVPEVVGEATCLVTNRLLKRGGSPEGISGFDEFGTIRISPREDPDAVRLLEPYRMNRRVGGWAFA
jgi:hypothetical protein